MYKGTGITSEYHLICRVRLFTHRQIHDIWIILCHTPVIFLMAIVVHTLESHFFRNGSYRIFRLGIRGLCHISLDLRSRLLTLGRVKASFTLLSLIRSVVASEPVEKVDVVSFSGQTVKTFTLNGKKDFTLSLKDLPKEKLVFVFQSSCGKATTDVDI